MWVAGCSTRRNLCTQFEWSTRTWLPTTLHGFCTIPGTDAAEAGAAVEQVMEALPAGSVGRAAR